MKNRALKISAFFLVVWYCFSIIGFGVHTCRASGRSFVTTVLGGLSCEDIHPEHRCTEVHCIKGHQLCCSHHVTDAACHGKNSKELTSIGDSRIQAPECCSNDYQSITLTGCASDDYGRFSDLLIYGFNLLYPDSSSCYTGTLLSAHFLKGRMISWPIVCRDIRSLLNIWRI